jgi:hypothetical protein
MNGNDASPERIRPGIYPFWFWNGDLTADEIRWQIRQMAEQGVRGFFIHPRQGLRRPYLSEAFFEMVAAAVDEAAAQNMEVHLYDEYPYPSGPAGGEVLLGNPHFHATVLVQKTFDIAGGRVRLALPRGKVLACTAYPIRDGQADWDHPSELRDCVGIVLSEDAYFTSGLTMYNRKRYFASRPVPVLEAQLSAGPHRLFVSVQTTEEHHRYWDHFADVMNPRAVQEFLRVTHERYRRHFADRFGGVIRSIFVDETEPRWSEHVPAAFAERFGHDLLPLLPALQDPSHPSHLQVAYDLRRLEYDLFCRSWEQPYADWCRAHNILYSGEKPAWRLSQLNYMDIPGCEPGHTRAGAKMDLLRPAIRSNARATASAAYFYGKPGSLCECYHSMGWSATLQDARIIADGLLLMGIDMLVPHGFFYSTHALRKHDAPPTFFFQMPYWPLFGRLSRRVDRIAAAFAGTHIAANILVVDPNAGLPDAAHRAAYQRLLDWLMAEHLDFLMVDTDILEAGTVEKGVVQLRDAAARVVIVPPMHVIEPALNEWLRSFEKAGGIVVRCRADVDESFLADRVLAAVQPSLRISADGGAADLQVVARMDGRRTCWLALNTGRRHLDVSLDAGQALREITLEDDRPALLEKTAGGYRRSFAPFEAVLLETSHLEQPSALPARRTVRVRGAAKVMPLRANLLRLYQWNMALMDSDGQVMQKATVPAVPLINQLQAGRFRFAPAVREYWGTISQLGLPPLRVLYCAAFANGYDGPVHLVMEPDSIVGDWSIRANDGEPLGPSAFTPVDMHVRGSLGADLTRHLRPGRNVIQVEVATDRHDGGLVNALYLAGDFAVALDGPSLTHRKPYGEFEAYEANGLPYYAGVAEYEMQVHVEEAPNEQPVLADFEFGPAFEDACEVSVNGGDWHALPWSPRQVLLPAGTLRAGANDLRVRVYTSLGRAFEAQVFDVPSHAYRDITAAAERS